MTKLQRHQRDEAAVIVAGSVAAIRWWTRLQPIRTAAAIDLAFALFTHEPFVYQRIGDEARRLRKLGMTLQGIATVFGVDEKTVRKVTSR